MKKETSQVANELIKRLDTHLDDENIGNPFFPERGIRPFPLATDGFKVIQRLDSDRKTAFIDGGNQEVFGAPNFSVQLNRVYFGMWSGNRRISESSTPKRIEFFAATFSDFERGEIQYNTSLFPLSGDAAMLPRERDLSFSSMDRSITVGNQRADIYRVGSISRRFSELVLAKSFDYDVTMCADAAANCPIFPGGVTYFHHPFDDPAAVAESGPLRCVHFRYVPDQIGEWIDATFSHDT